MTGHFVVAPALTCSARSGLQARAVRRAQRMRCEFLVSPLTLSQSERGLNPFSLWEKGGDEGKTHLFHRIRSLCESK